MCICVPLQKVVPSFGPPVFLPVVPLWNSVYWIEQVTNWEAWAAGLPKHILRRGGIMSQMRSSVGEPDLPQNCMEAGPVQLSTNLTEIGPLWASHSVGALFQVWHPLRTNPQFQNAHNTTAKADFQSCCSMLGLPGSASRGQELPAELLRTTHR